MEHRTPDQLPDFHVLRYSEELSTPFLEVTDHLFYCQFSSLDGSGKIFAVLDEVDTSKVFTS